MARPQGRIDSTDGIDYEIQRINESISPPFKVDRLVEDMGERFGAGAESRVFIRRILEAIPGENMQTLEVEFFDDPDAGPGEYLRRSRKIRINTAHDINRGDGVAMVFAHEAGHFFTEEVLGMTFVMDQWQSLSDAQRQSAWAQYAKVNSVKNADIDSEALFNSVEAAHEWSAMQFHRVAAAGKSGRKAVTAAMKNEGVKQGLIDRIIAWVDQVRDWFKSWMGDPNLSTQALDKAFATALGAEYATDADIKTDAEKQGEFLLRRAFEAGYDSVNTFASEDISGFTEAAKQWRNGARLDSPDNINRYEPPENEALNSLERAGSDTASARLDDARRAVEDGQEAADNVSGGRPQTKSEADQLGRSLLDPQQQALLRWTQSQGLTLDADRLFRNWKRQVDRDREDGYDEPGGGSENLVAYDPPQNRWTKINTLNYHLNHGSLLRRIDAHNRLFSEAPLTLGGVITGDLSEFNDYIGDDKGIYSDADVHVVLHQRHVNKTAPSPTGKEVAAEMKRRGFKGVVSSGFAEDDGRVLWRYAKPDENPTNFYHPDYEVFVSDLHPENVFREDGKIVFMDPMISFPWDFDKPIEEQGSDRLGSPDTVLRNSDIRKRLQNSPINNREVRTAAIAPEVTGRAEKGKQIVLENAWATHQELRFAAFKLYKSLRDRKLFDGTFDQFYREYTDTPITPQEAETYIDNFEVEIEKLNRKDLSPDRKRAVDDYLIHEFYETIQKINKRTQSDSDARDSAVDEVTRLKDRLATYQKKYNDATALEAEALKQVRSMLDTFKRALNGGKAAKLGRLGEVIRNLEGQKELDNRIARKYLLGIERLINAKRFDLFDILDQLAGAEANFDQPVADLRKDFRESGLGKLADLSDSEFAAVIALAQADKHLMDTIVLRKIPEAKEKLAIVESEVAEMNGDFTRAKKATTNVKRYATLKGRLAASRAQITSKIRRRERRIKELEQRIAISREAREHFNAEFQKGLGRVGATTRGEIIEGVGLFNPASENAKPSEIQGSLETFSYEDTTQEDITRILAAQKKWLDGPEAELAKDEDPVFYNQVLTQSTRLMERTFRKTAGTAQSTFGKFSRFYFDALANSFDKTNTRGGRAMGQMLQRIEAMGSTWQNEATTLGERADKARTRLGKALGFDRKPDIFTRQFRDIVDTPMKFYMEQPGSTIRGFIRERIDKKASPEMIRMFEAYYEAELANAQFVRRVTEESMNAAGLGSVTNNRILVPDWSKGGELTPIEQTHRNLGTATFMIRPNFEQLESVVHMADEGKFGTVNELARLVNSIKDDTDPSELDKAIDDLFRDPLAYDRIVGALARKDKVPVFVDEDGELIERVDAMEAFEKSSSPSEFFRALGGSTETVKDNLESVRRLYADISTVVRERDQKKESAKVAGEPHTAIDSRKADTWPSEWLSFRMGGSTANHIIVHENVIASVFGKDGERLKGERKSILGELQKIRDKAQLSGDLSGLNRANERISDASRLFDQLDEVLGSQLGPLRDLRLGQELMGTLVGGVLNGPRAAMVQLNQIYQPILHFGLSKTTARIAGTQLKTLIQDVLGSVFEAMGVTLFRESEAFKTQKRLYGLEPEKINGFWDFTGDMGNEGRIGGLQRRVRILNNLMTRRGLSSRAQAEQALYSSFKPWAPFSQLIGGLHKAPMIAFRGEYDRLAGAAIKYALKVKPEGGDLTGIKWDPKAMGYSKAEFEKLNGLLEYRVGVTLADIVARHRGKKGKGAPFTDSEYKLMSSIGLDLMASEANVFTTRSPQMHTQMGRWVFPLLGWALHQPHHAAKMFKGAEGEVTRRTVTAGIMTLSFGLVPAVMAMAMFEDWFDEEIMGKKRNLRPLTGDGFKGGALAVLERVTRNGMLGMPMEIVNLGVNGVGGGDMRTASLDQRVFLMNSIRGAVQMAGNIYAQKTVTGTDLIRAGQLAGGNGLLQQVDMFSNLLELDNLPHRRTDRISATNYLRVGGRIIGLELNGYSGGFRPTPVTPWVSQMMLASIADDPAAFQKYYQKAVEAARKHMDHTGPGEAEDYVAKSWTSRHPLKGPFKTSPTPEQYQTLLGAIGNNGAEEVRTMVDNYNRYALSIGARPYNGKEPRSSRSRSTARVTMADLTGLR